MLRKYGLRQLDVIRIKAKMNEMDGNLNHVRKKLRVIKELDLKGQKARGRIVNQ